MGVLTDFFIATDQELFAVFRGWKRAAPLLDECVTRTLTNPFTRQPVTIRTRIRDDQPVADADAAEECDFRHLPWIDQKGISTGEVVQLACVVMSWDREIADDEVHGRMLIGPAGALHVVCEILPALRARLATLSPEDCTRFGAEWTAMFRRDAETIQDEFTRNAQLARADAEWISRLSDIASLAKRAIAEGRGLFLWMCP